MTSLSDVKVNVVDLLAHVSTGGGLSAAAGGEADAEGAAGGFVEALGRRLRELLVQAGADPAEVAALDGQALLAQCMSLVQGQTQSVPIPLPIPLPIPPDVDTAVPLTPGKVPETPAELLEWLRQSGGVETSEPAETFAVGTAEVEAEADAQLDSDRGELPAFARRLLHALHPETAEVDLDTSDARNREPLRSAALAPTDLAGLARPDGASRLPPGPVTAVSVPVTSDGVADTDPLEPLPMQQAVTRPVALAERVTETIGGRAVSPEPEPLRELVARLADADAGPRDAAAESAADAPPVTTLGLIGSLAAERQHPAARAQVLDLSRLLQPGGEARLAEQVTWVLQGGSGSAKLELHPANLGPLDVRITVEDDQAHVHFVSPHPVVREVLEAALPRLRESLAQDGVTLVNVSVSDQASGGRGEAGQGAAAGGWSAPPSESEPSVETEEPPAVRSTLSALAGRHDYFA